MHNNYYFIRQLVNELQSLLPGLKLFDSYSQNKDEAIFSFVGKSKEFHIISHLTGQFTCLAFPQEYNKAKKNTATIFPDLLGKSVKDVHGYENERALSIEFDDGYLLVFKLYGRQSNLILFKGSEVQELFKKGYKTDLGFNSGNIDRPIDQSKDAIIKSLPDYRSVFPTLHKKMISYIDNEIVRNSGSNPADIIIKTIDSYCNPAGYQINTSDTKTELEIVIEPGVEGNIKLATEASTKFFFNYLRSSQLTNLRTRLLNDIDKRIGKSEVYISKVRRKLYSLENESNHKTSADLLMANLHNVPGNSDKVSLEDFFEPGKFIEIKLNPLLSAQQNAEKYYKKAKNVNLEIDNLRSSIAAKEKLILNLNEDKAKIEEADNLSTLRQFSRSDKSKKESKTVPFKEFLVGDYTVYVGNNAKQNDLLTLKYAKKDDLFFHAKDVSGSHVILKNRPGSNVPARVLETTASIAAYYSKRRTDTLCPVGYTPKKYVRKPKGSPPGRVVVEREKVLLVSPQLP